MMSSAPCAFSACDDRRHQRLVAGGERADTPTACTSFSIAWRAHSSAVWNSGPMSTSKPRSAKAVATTLAPRSWPSWPSLAIITRGRRPCASAKAAISALQLVPALGAVVGGCVHTGHLLRVGAVAAADLLQRIAAPRPPWRAGASPGCSGRAGCPAPVSAQARQRVERGLHRGGVARGAHRLQARDLVLAHRVVVDLADLDRRLPWRACTC